MWIITDQYCEDPKAIGWSSSDFRKPYLPMLRHRFRLLCDDGEICYEGKMDSDPLDGDAWRNEGPLQPLTNFGMGRYGCSRIEYFCAGAWMPL